MKQAIDFCCENALEVASVIEDVKTSEEEMAIKVEDLRMLTADLNHFSTLLNVRTEEPE